MRTTSPYCLLVQAAMAAKVARVVLLRGWVDRVEWVGKEPKQRTSKNIMKRPPPRTSTGTAFDGHRSVGEVEEMFAAVAGVFLGSLLSTLF